jgi:hypothetical protein
LYSQISSINNSNPKQTISGKGGSEKIDEKLLSIMIGKYFPPPNEWKSPAKRKAKAADDNYDN